MTKKQEGWISRRGQVNAAAAVELVLERQPQETVQQIADKLIEDSPYQARQPISDASVEELAQGMRSAGFQGVLIVRPHADAAKRRQGMFQLVYGHRRRVAWRRVCQEHGEPCALPVVVREISDAQLLTIGAQENLQRQDLDPVEEGQIVAWAERMFFDKNQAQIGILLGKSEDWIRIRSRVAKLPEPLKSRLRARPRAMSQILELNPLYKQDSKAALVLADRVVEERLTLDTLRELLRSNPFQKPFPHSPRAREEPQTLPSNEAATLSSSAHLQAPRVPIYDEFHNRGGAAAIVTDITDYKEIVHASEQDTMLSLTNQLRDIQHLIASAQQHMEVFRMTLHNAQLQDGAASNTLILHELLTALIIDLDTLRVSTQKSVEDIGVSDDR